MAKQGHNGITWTDETWNPVTGCTKVSHGCKHCYAEREWHRLQRLPDYAGRAFTDVRCHADRIDQPLHWRRPRRVFVNSMSDLFHESVPDDFIDQVFAVMALATQHTFQILTKRPDRMLSYFSGRPQRMLDWWRTNVGAIAAGNRSAPNPASHVAMSEHNPRELFAIPFPNVWLGVSVEDQATADERIPLLLKTPASVRWVSAEPLLGSVSLSVPFDGYKVNAAAGARPGIPPLNWVVVGGESGPKARPMHPDWARSLRDQCEAAGVPFLYKQHGEWISGKFDRRKGKMVCDPTPDHPTGRIFWTNPGEPQVHLWGEADHYWTHASARVGKAEAGRLLDGVLHDEYPREVV